VVAFDLPPVREVMGGHGLLAPVGDVAALTDRLAQALTDPSAAARLGRAGQERFDACYDLDVVTPRMCELYARVAAEPVRRWWR
jgi:glycosyltransferase involved in cell wall biosynthesis